MNRSEDGRSGVPPRPRAGEAARRSRPRAGESAGSRPRAGDSERPRAGDLAGVGAAMSADAPASGAHRSAGSRGAPRSSVPRPDPGQPLTATWDPPAETDLDHEGFVATYGWRAYAIPVLAILTVVLLVLTVRGGSADGSADKPSPDEGRDTQVAKESAPVGAPTVQIAEAALPVGALPPGGHFTRQAKKSFHVVPVKTSKKIGRGAQEYTYTVEVEDGLIATDFSGDNAFATMVDATLANRHSWIGGGKVSFKRVGAGQSPNLRISLTSTNTARELCGYQIKLESSCFYPPTNQVLLNEARWVRGAISFDGDIHSYRQYQINHEVGHGIGYAQHEPCKQNGKLAPIMMQQSFGVRNKDIMGLDPQMDANPALSCKPNPWPFP
ncbi:MAG: DUF3152 domain-containing protein [Gordonia sp. (in: high G+C Gram-positive bacteria)]|uniref:DUF3152 domain-containing protein n=1 Tax=Gordonia sp. (in: high G+C Gram-positive bacteria) TaxID=84139 RepID=UPI0039E488A2